MTVLDSVRIDLWNPDASGTGSDLDGLAVVLHACVHAGASVSFILPFSRDDARAFWHDQVLPGVHGGSRRVLLARQRDRIVGTVQLDLATPPNQPHRAEVKKLLVHPDARRQGIARSLMIAAELEARAADRTLLTLDTVQGGAAEPLYRLLGYREAGVIPRFALKYDASSLESTVVFYKALSDAAPD